MQLITSRCRVSVHQVRNQCSGSTVIVQHQSVAPCEVTSVDSLRPVQYVTHHFDHDPEQGQIENKTWIGCM